jgi:hypothetical protein
VVRIRVDGGDGDGCVEGLPCALKVNASIVRMRAPNSRHQSALTCANSFGILEMPIVTDTINLAKSLCLQTQGDVIDFYNISSGMPLGQSIVAAAPYTTKDPAAVQAMRRAYATMMAPPISAHFVAEVQHHFEQVCAAHFNPQRAPCTL